MNIHYDAKTEYLQFEGDNYFERNLEKNQQREATLGAQLLYGFISSQMRGGGYSPQGKKMLEIGCCYGYNLAYFYDKCGFSCYGVEPSGKAIRYGKQLFNNKVEFLQGTADELKYKDKFFDVVMVGTCLYQVDRALLRRTLSEIDRVVADGGFLVISDFDTPVPCKRENKHNQLTPTYKDNYGDMFLRFPYKYTLIEKKTYLFNGAFIFSDDIQERMSTQILYKEKGNLYY